MKEFILTESSSTGTIIVGSYNTELEANNKAHELHNNYCDYNIYKLA